MCLQYYAKGIVTSHKALSHCTKLVKGLPGTAPCKQGKGWAIGKILTMLSKWMAG